MKYRQHDKAYHCGKSPSIRREWIEMPWLYTQDSEAESPSIRREWIEISISQPKVLW